MNSSKFSDYMIENPQFLKQLFEFALTYPDEISSDDKQKFKFPFIASELLGCQISGLVKFLLQNERGNIQNANESVGQKDSEDIDKNDIVNEEKKEEEEEEEADSEKIDNSNSQEEQVKNQPEEQIEQPQQEEQKKTEEIKEENETQVENAQQETQNQQQEEIDNKAEKEVDEESQKDILQSDYQILINNKKENDIQDLPCEIKQQEQPQASDQNDQNSQQSKATEEISGFQILDILFNFINSDQILDSTLAGYFGKIVQTLVSKEGTFWKYLLNNILIVNNLLNHLYLKSVSKILTLLILNEGIEIEPDPFEENRKYIINELFHKFEVCEDKEVLLNIQDILVSINQCSLMPQNFEIKQALFELKNIDVLVNSISNNKPAFSQASFILSNYLDQYYITLFNENYDDQENNNGDYLNFDRKNDEIIYKKFPLEHLQQQTKQLVQALINFDTEGEEYFTQFGSLQKSYGLNRTKLLHLILNLLKSESVIVNDQIAETKFYSYLLGLIQKHQWNNILHNQIEFILNQSFIISATHEGVRNCIINEAKFINFLAENCMQIRTTPGNSKKSITKGYLCMFIRIANDIEKQKTNFNWLQKAVDESPEWKEFTEHVLSKMNLLETINLGNYNPKKNKQSEDEDKEKNTNCNQNTNSRSSQECKNNYMKFMHKQQNKEFKEAIEDDEDYFEDECIDSTSEKKDENTNEEQQIKEDQQNKKEEKQQEEEQCQENQNQEEEKIEQNQKDEQENTEESQKEELENCEQKQNQEEESINQEQNNIEQELQKDNNNDEFASETQENKLKN